MKHAVFIALSLLSLCSLSQATYWQQQTDYEIEVALNDTLHTLDGFVKVTYKNNSPETLHFILFHLWPNAYRDQSTPFAKQQLENGETKFHYSKQRQRGFIDHLDFKVNAEVCDWDYEPGSFEIARINLIAPLKPGDSVTISTPFRVKIPDNFSRLGHVGQSYQISQWYPKPAVFDKNGWNAMPYLDQGEFYSEFGSFDVSITVPKNYVVGATGDLQDNEELQWLDSISRATEMIESFSSDMTFPVSSAETKTLRYIQNNVHDFAWFADKRYHVLKGEVVLPLSKRKVTTWSMFTNNQAELWREAPEYLHDATYYYSKWVGEYPYNQVTAVDGTISAGGGMEYPNITIIGEASSAFDLDLVITHEVGHNWFYGILASNERKHAWMDEGVNSYYENRYLRLKYPDRRMVGDFPKGLAKSFDLLHYKHKYLMDLAYQVMARENIDQPIAIPSDEFTAFNYGAIVYGKTMLLFDYLEAFWGTERFDSLMKVYYETWKFKHPQPEDFRVALESNPSEMGRYNLRWFFDGLIETNSKIDFALSKGGRKHFLSNDTHQNNIKVTNKGTAAGWANLAYLTKDSVIDSKWIWVTSGSSYVEAIRFKDTADKIQIDPLLKIPEINRRNNTYFFNKRAHFFEKLRFQFLGSIENQTRTQVFFAPYFGWNNYDKTQVGIALYSPFLPTRKFNYLVVPTIGTGSKQFIGFAKFSYNFFPETVQRFTVGINAKRFSYILFPQPLMFNKIEPYVHIEFRKKRARSPYTHALHMRSVVVWLGWIRYDNRKRETQRYFVNEIKYSVERKTTLHPFTATATFRQGNNFANLSAEGNFTISYKRKDEGFRVRLFAGGFILNTKSSSDISSPNPKFYLSMASTNNFAYWLQKDYMFDENFVDRNGRDKYLNRQVAKIDGAFRSFTNFGATNQFLSSVNITSTTHRFFPIQPFVNAAFLVNDLKKTEFAAEFGLSAVILRDMIEIHLPLATTKNITDNQKVLGITKWYQRFTFTLKWQLQKPIDLIRRFL